VVAVDARVAIAPVLAQHLTFDHAQAHSLEVGPQQNGVFADLMVHIRVELHGPSIARTLRAVARAQHREN
jgi:hypothetical protein